MSATRSKARALTALVVLAFAPWVMSATSQARSAGGAYRVRPVFALAARHGWVALRPMAVGARSGKHAPNPAFAGYLTARSGVTTVVARFKVPGVACTRQEAAISPGAFLLSGPSDRESLNAANVIVGCFRGTASAQEAMVVNDVEFDFVRALYRGDVMIARLTDDPGHQTVVQLRDVTPGHKFVITKSGLGATPDAQLVGDWGSVDQRTQAELPPPDFERTTFRSILVDGHPLGSIAPVGYDMTSSRNVLQIATSPLTGSARDSFTCTRKFPRG